MLSTTDYVFDTQDVVREYVKEDGTRVRLYAYKTRNNDKLLEKKEYKGLRWVSLGKPEIIELNNNTSLFSIQNKLSFSLRFEMLTHQDKEELADEVKRAIKVSVWIHYNFVISIQTQLNVKLNCLIKKNKNQLF
jgi:hypothetical protein